MKKLFSICIVTVCFAINANSQLKWKLVDTVELPKNVQLFFTNDSIEGKPNKAYYIKAKLNEKHLLFDVDTTLGRRLTPIQFYEKNNKPIVVVNGTFFSFETNKNLNVVIKNSKIVSHNIKSVQRKDSAKKNIDITINRSAIGIYKNRKADVAWIKTDTGKRRAFAQQKSIEDFKPFSKTNNIVTKEFEFYKWKVKTAIGGGPVLIQQGIAKITNDYEQMFAGKKGLTDKHPRTAMGYTNDGYLIIMVIEGRFPGVAEGASLVQEAKMLVDIGCVEALNLDGGGSSCMLVNGKETIKPSDKGIQRAVPAIFMLKTQ